MTKSFRSIQQEITKKERKEIKTSIRVDKSFRLNTSIEVPLIRNNWSPGSNPYRISFGRGGPSRNFTGSTKATACNFPCWSGI